MNGWFDMTIDKKQKLTLDRPAVYQIQVPGHLDAGGQDWLGTLKLECSRDETGLPITHLVGSLDQAALIGLLRRLYSLGLPLISVTYLEDKSFKI
jgi:hypothetical protein